MIYELLIAVLSVLLYGPVGRMVHGHPQLGGLIYNTSDIRGNHLRDRLLQLDARWGSRWVPPLVVAGLTLMAYRFTAWHTIDPAGVLRPTVVFLCALIVWKGTTLDVDLATGERLLRPRVIALTTLALLWIHPGWSALLLFTIINYLRGWYHHQHLLLRALLMFVSTTIAALLLQIADHVVGFPGFMVTGVGAEIAILGCIASHYTDAAVGKLRLGDHWWSWMLENRLHHLAISAYLWGWTRRRRDPLSLARVLAVIDRPLQIATVLFELSGFFIGFHRWTAVAFFATAALFHLFVFAVAGLLFWQLILVCGFLAIGIAALPDAQLACFGVIPGFTLIGIVILISYYGRGLSPESLAWWDTPYVARVQWRLVGQSGMIYDLHNGFMCPNERLFGKWDFRTTEPALTGHLGEIRDGVLRKKILATRGQAAELDQLKRDYGRPVLTRAQSDEIDRYLRDFFVNYNGGAPKRVCPPWMKAPGGMYFRWGERPAFRGQEPVWQLVVAYREEFFDGERVVTLRDEPLRTIDIGPLLPTRQTSITSESSDKGGD